MFVHSTDGGQTWAINGGQDMAGFYALALSMVDNNTGYAAVDNVITQETSVAKYS